MSISYFRQLNKNRDLRALVKEIVARIARLEQVTDPLDQIEFNQIIRANNDRIIYVDEGSTEVNASVPDPNQKNYQLPLEPDGHFLTLWFRMQNASAGLLRDSSGLENNATIVGSPSTQNSPVEGMPGWQFTEDDLLRIANAATINLQGTTTGITISFRINPIAITDMGGKHRVIACKTDDSTTTRNYGFIIWLEPNGDMYFHVRIANIFYTRQKLFAFPSLNKWYTVFCTFQKSDSTPHIWIDGLDSTDPVMSNYLGGLTLPTQSLDMYIGGTDETNASRLSAVVADFRYWREKVVNDIEQTNYINNGYSISPITSVARVGVATTLSEDPYGAPPPPPGPPSPPPPPPGTALVSFSITSFTSTSFH